ncbi:hypothetical protein BDF20DRAFT_827089, partial [Mycotypha africana]|uniref:uncharacterized protein n=1 Tax=Mycotypha africana TaxID=64632 RepID=UPI0023018283
VEPVQRISRYSLMLRGILQLTPAEHPEYNGLQAACEKAREIATLADDNPTKTATMFLNLYQAIKDSPCSLINQKRLLIAHLDAIEIHRVTNKPTRAVSIFLFTDKILVASRSSIDSKEINLDQILHNSNPSDKPTLKFKGWADVESIEMFDGVPVTVFRESYQRTRALMKRYDTFNDKVYYKLWSGVPTFCNVYTAESYMNAKYKSDTAIIYVDHPQIETEEVFSDCSPLYSPWIVGLIQPEDMKGFRFQVCTRVNFPAYKASRSASNLAEQTIDFENIFWNNRKYIP